jgi:hypothetical protein
MDLSIHQKMKQKGRRYSRNHSDVVYFAGIGRAKKVLFFYAPQPVGSHKGENEGRNEPEKRSKQ